MSDWPSAEWQSWPIPVDECAEKADDATDHDLNKWLDLCSINYLHYGEANFWYSIPPEHARRFERMADILFPNLLKKCRILFATQIVVDLA